MIGIFIIIKETPCQDLPTIWAGSCRFNHWLWPLLPGLDWLNVRLDVRLDLSLNLLTLLWVLHGLPVQGLLDHLTPSLILLVHS